MSCEQKIITQLKYISHLRKELCNHLYIYIYIGNSILGVNLWILLDFLLCFIFYF